MLNDNPPRGYNSVVLLFLAFAIAGIVSGPGYGHVRDPEDCDVGKTSNRAFGNVNEPPSYAFRWESSAGSQDGQWCYDRIVSNRHTSNPLVYDWRSASLSSVYGLAPGEESHNNFNVSEGPPEKHRGPLFYGVKKDKQRATVVYSTPGEATGKASGRIAMVIRDSTGQTLRIRLNLGTSIDPSLAWGYAHQFVNRGDPINIIWAPTKVASFALAAKKVVPGWDLGEPFPIQGGGDLAVKYTGSKPRLVLAPVFLVDSAGKIIATSVVPTYIPR